MKHSEMINLLERLISSRNTCHYSYDSIGHAEDVLSALEDVGMLPPWSEESKLCFCPSFSDCPGCNISRFKSKWEKE